MPQYEVCFTQMTTPSRGIPLLATNAIWVSNNEIIIYKILIVPKTRPFIPREVMIHQREILKIDVIRSRRKIAAWNMNG